MSEDKKQTRNPLVIPQREVKLTGCPKCGHPHFDGFVVQGVLTRTCRSKECRNVWQGGLPQEPMDPRIPYPPDLSQAPVSFESKAPRSEQQMSMPSGVVEVRHNVDLRQEFRKGAPIPDGEE